MALDALATATDLDNRGIVLPDTVDGDALLASASAAVRDAAGCSITYGASTVTLVAQDWCDIDLPAGPVASVASVTVDSVAVTGWRKVGDKLLMPTGWTRCLPVEVTVTYTHGYPVIPADIIDLVCGMVAIAGGQSSAGYGDAGRIHSVRLGDFAETYTNPSDSPSPFALPDRVREALRARFGSNVAVLRVH